MTNKEIIEKSLPYMEDLQLFEDYNITDIVEKMRTVVNTKEPEIDDIEEAQKLLPSGFAIYINKRKNWCVVEITKINVNLLCIGTPADILLYCQEHFKKD